METRPNAADRGSPLHNGRTSEIPVPVGNLTFKLRRPIKRDAHAADTAPWIFESA